MKRTLLGLTLAVLGFTACQPDNARQAEILSRQTTDGLTLTMHADWLFPAGAPELRPEADTTLRQLARQVRQKGSQQLLVRGYTDAAGDDNANAQLAQARAEAIAGWLRQHEVTIPMEVQGVGEANPVAPNDTPEGQAQNRRIEVVLR